MTGQQASRVIPYPINQLIILDFKDFWFIICTHGVYETSKFLNIFGEAVYFLNRILKLAKTAKFQAFAMQKVLNIYVTNDAAKGLYISF